MRALLLIVFGPIVLGVLLALSGGDPRWSCWSPLPQVYGSGCHPTEEKKMDLSLQDAAERIEQRLEAIERRLAAIEENTKRPVTSGDSADPAPRRTRK